jgi:subtilisin family serine protease
VPTPVTAPVIKPTSSPAPSATGGVAANPTAFTCPSSDAASTTSGARFGAQTASRHRIDQAGTTPPAGTTYLAVNYSRPTLTQTNVRAIQGRESALGATFVASNDYPRLDYTQRVIAVPTAAVAKTEASLRAQSGVQSVGTTGERRFRLTSASVTTNDPYFAGFPKNNNAVYHESTNIPGQWDMYAIGLDHAFGYSQAAGNTLGVGNPLALGSSAIKIAIIDTGEDTHHPELANKIAYQKCFITNAAGTAQSIGSYTTDEDGHGTNVAGIAAAAGNNGLGFIGAGGNSVIYGYRVFPTPNDSCSSPTSTDPQCSTSTADIAAAINDAVQQNVNVISLSLGGGSCDSSGTDSDPVENAAVKNALTAGVIVVAASGNAGGQSVTAPACVPNVIAVGATGLDDGQPTGTVAYSTSRAATASATAPVEYVASYSQYGATNTFRSASSWGIVAPGGDPSNADISSSSATDDLHWIENIWTTTPFGGQSDPNFAGACSSDFGSSGPIDCRTEIAGTSMATPHVAGAAALILAVNSSYRTPAAMKQLLCQTADDLGDTHQGCGRLNLYRAMAVALHDPSAP